MHMVVFNNKIGQVMVWVIVAIGLVASIVLLFLLRDKILKPGLEERAEDDPKIFIEDCVKESVNEGVDIMIPQGGFVNPKHSIMYNDIKIEYLCHSVNYYEKCVTQHPVYLQEIEKEIKDYIEPRLDKCFNNYEFEMEKRKNDILISPMKLDVELGNGKVYVKIDRKVIITKNDESREIKDFNFEIKSPIYDLANAALEITANEVLKCDFDNVNYMMNFPRFKIKRFIMSDSTKIYNIVDLDSGKELNIAIRGCASSPGL